MRARIEFGSGTTVLPKFFEAKIPDEYFKDKVNEYLERTEFQ